MKTINLSILVCLLMLPVVLAITVHQAVNRYDDAPEQTKRSFKDNKAVKNFDYEEEDVCGCQCMVGPAGQPGVPGVHGQPGQQGRDGRDGRQGDKGDMGAQGPKGMTGEEGPVGPSGSRGKRGEKGIQGHLGVPGPLGLKGERGYTGLSGVKGDKGDSCSPTKQVAFSVARSQRLGPVLQDTTITFDNIFTNIGGGFDEYTSHFVCKVNGTYLFTTHILSLDNKDMYAWIMLNNKHKVPLHGDREARYGTGSQSIILSLRKGDQVWMQLSKESGLLNDYSTFTGFLLFEENGATNTEEEEISNHLQASSYDYWRWRK